MPIDLSGLFVAVLVIMHACRLLSGLFVAVLVIMHAYRLLSGLFVAVGMMVRQLVGALSPVIHIGLYQS